MVVKGDDILKPYARSSCLEVIRQTSGAVHRRADACVSHRKTRGHDLPDECSTFLGHLKIVEEDRFAGGLTSHARRAVVECPQTYLCDEQIDDYSGGHQAEHVVGRSCVKRTSCGHAELES